MQGGKLWVAVGISMSACMAQVEAESLEQDLAKLEQHDEPAIPFADATPPPAETPEPTEPAPPAPEEPPAEPETAAGTTPHLKMMREWMDHRTGYRLWAGAGNRCPGWVGARGVPSITTDGRWLVHGFAEDSWYSDGGEFWWDSSSDEPHDERGGVWVDLQDMSEQPVRVLEESDVVRKRMRHAEAERMLDLIDCEAYDEQLRAGIERVNARFDEHPWRPLTPGDDLGILVGGYAYQDGVPTADLQVEVVWRANQIAFRVPGVTVLHRVPTHAPMHRFEIDELYIDMETGAGVIQLSDHAVCFGDESTEGVPFVLPPRALDEIRKRRPTV